MPTKNKIKSPNAYIIYIIYQMNSKPNELSLTHQITLSLKAMLLELT